MKLKLVLMMDLQALEVSAAFNVTLHVAPLNNELEKAAVLEVWPVYQATVPRPCDMT